VQARAGHACTVWGKSAVYFIAALLFRARNAGPMVIVGSLLALMRNQVAAAERPGVRAVTINSSNVGEWSEIYAEVQRDVAVAGRTGAGAASAL
jgi:ATP-dependent DNA helicase RecQ